MVRRKRFAGFTLIELLVVIAIITLLVSILLPSLKQARELARSAVCKSNLHSQAFLVHLYSNDFDGIMVPAYDFYGNNYGDSGWQVMWHFHLGAYIEPNAALPQRVLGNIWATKAQPISDLKIFFCPSQFPAFTWSWSIRYGINPYNASYKASESSYRWIHMEEFTQPSQKILLSDTWASNDPIVDADYAEYVGEAVVGGGYSGYLFIYFPSQYHGLPSERHLGGSNTLFVDGSIQHAKWDTLVGNYDEMKRMYVWNE